jgi:Icc-related predicted phosphoesterase
MTKFRILAFSDYRVQSLEELYDYISNLSPEPDVIVYAGDDVNRFDGKEKSLFEYFADLTSFGLYGVIGNDCSFKDKEILSGDGVHDLHDDPVIAENFIFLGNEGGLKDFPIGGTLYSEEEVTDHLEGQLREVKEHLESKGLKIDNYKLILVSHNPPFRVLDLAIRHGRENIGSKAIREFIIKNGIFLTVCGHVHLQGGKLDKLNKSTIINVASHDNPGSKGKIGIIDIIGDEIGVTFVEIPEWDEKSLYNLYSIRESTVKKLKAQGFKNIDDIIGTEFRDFISSTGLSQDSGKRVYLNAKAIDEGEPFLLKPLEFDERDVAYFDIELGGSEKDGTMIFLISCLHAEHKKVKHFFADINTLKEEKRVLIEFLKHLEESKIKKLYCYSRNKFDFRWLKKRIEAHDLQNDATISHGLQLIEDGYDIFWIIKHHVVPPINNMKLKELGIAFGFKCRQYPEIDTHNIGGFYYDYIETKDRIIAKKMFEYNEDDVLVIDHIISKMKTMDVFDVQIP